MSGEPAGGAGSGYRGADRRGSGSGHTPTSGTVVARDGLLLVAAAATLSTAAAAAWHVSVAGPVLSPVLAGAGSGLALLIGEHGYVRWRLVGDMVAARVAAALFVYGVVVIPLACTSGDGAVGTIVAWLGTMAALVLLLPVIWDPDVDSTARLAGTVGAVAGATGAFVLAAFAAPGIAIGLTELRLGPAPAVFVTGGGALIAMAAALTAAGVARNRRLLTITGAALGILVVVPAIADASADSQHARTVAAAVQVAALGCVLMVSARDRRLALAEAGRYNAGLRARWLDAVAAADAATRSHADAAHAIRSALVSIQGATQVLAVHRGALDPSDEAELTTAVTSEITRLQALVAPGQRKPERPGQVLLVEVLGPLVAAHQATGQRITLDVPARLAVRGHVHLLVEAVGNLLVNAAVHAPGAAVRISTAPSPHADCVRVLVADDGPGFTADGARHALERGWRGPDASDRPGSGLGLHLAAGVVTRDGGSLTVLPAGRNRGGARIALDLLVAEPAEELGEVVGGR